MSLLWLWLQEDMVNLKRLLDLWNSWPLALQPATWLDRYQYISFLFLLLIVFKFLGIKWWVVELYTVRLRQSYNHPKCELLCMFLEMGTGEVLILPCTGNNGLNLDWSLSSLHKYFNFISNMIKNGTVIIVLVVIFPSINYSTRE